ncbi:helix-turn-helix domain-containing protein [bacterium]|nr:MAG: helix-turn-helix domain-containing protein [bacterium]
MHVICLEDEAFYALVEQVVGRIKEQHQVVAEKWISGDEAMKLLRITSKTTLQKLRDEGKIRFSQPEKKIILYDVDSIHTFLNKHARNPY